MRGSGICVRLTNRVNYARSSYGFHVRQDHQKQPDAVLHPMRFFSGSDNSWYDDYEGGSGGSGGSGGRGGSSGRKTGRKTGRNARESSNPDLDFYEKTIRTKQRQKEQSQQQQQQYQHHNTNRSSPPWRSGNGGSNREQFNERRHQHQPRQNRLSSQSNRRNPRFEAGKKIDIDMNMYVNSSNIQFENTKDLNKRDFKNRPPPWKQRAEAQRGRTKQPEAASSAKHPHWFPPKDLRVMISCLPGLETSLSMELTSLGLTHEVTPGGAMLQDISADDIFQCHLFLGTASNVLIQCGEPFPARQLAELERKVSNMHWRKFLKRSICLEARVTATKSKMYHTTAIRDRVVRAIYHDLGYNIPLTEESASAKKSSRDDGADPVTTNTAAAATVTSLESLLEKVADFVPVKLNVRVHRDLVTIFVDTALTPLHQRGYKLDVAKAPLREDLAYAMLLQGGWIPQFESTSFTNQNGSKLAYKSLVDPMCGCGTIPIEAAAMAVGLPPGRLRPSPLEGTRLQNSTKWKKLLAAEIPEERSMKKTMRRRFIHASDRDGGAITATKANAVRAGVGDLIDIDQLAIKAQPWFEDPNTAPTKGLLLATNPPYGKRISHTKGQSTSEESKSSSNKHPLLPLYQTLGHAVGELRKAGKDVGTVFMAHDRTLLFRTGILSLSSKFQCSHGGVPVTAMSSPIPGSDVAASSTTTNEDSDDDDDDDDDDDEQS